MGKYFVLLSLNLPLLAEVTRKYLLPNDFVFLAGDLIALTTFMSLAMSGALRGQLPKAFYWILPFLLMWLLAQQAANGHNLGLFGIGFRATFFPIVYLFLSAYLISRYSDGMNLLFISASSWLLISGCMAVLQIYLGPHHPINAVWGNDALGAGDYANSEGEIAIQGLFRPTSIFTHTGKFGQAAFALVLFRWCVLAFSGIKVPRWSYLIIGIDVATIFASGQRAAFIFLSLSILGMAYYARQAKHGMLLKWFAGAGCLALVIALFFVFLPDYGGAVQERFASGLTAIPVRLEGNLWLPLKSVMKEHFMSGEGFGYFTFGSRLFGGSIAYETLQLEGVGESSFIRICGEIGLVGALSLGLLFITLLLQGMRQSRFLLTTPLAGSAIFYVLWITSLILWCNTADVFGNTVGIFTGYGYSGAILLIAASKTSGSPQLAREAYGNFSQ